MDNVFSLPQPQLRGTRAIAETEPAARVQEVLHWCHAAPDMARISGPSGVGKTTAARDYARGRKAVWLIQMEERYGALKSGMRRICEAVGGYPGRTSREAMDNAELRIERAMESSLFDDEVSAEQGHGLLIFDEAQLMGDDLLDQTRFIHENTGVGIVYMGNASFPNRFKGPAAEAKFQQLDSRFGPRTKLDPTTHADIEAVCKHRGITHERLVKALGKYIEARGGGLRTVDKALRRAAAVANGRGAAALTAEDFESALRWMLDHDDG